MILSQQLAQIPKSEMGLLRFLFYVAINEFPCWISFHNFLWNNISGERAQTSGESFQNSNNLTLISVSVFGSLELKRWLWLGVCIDPSKKVLDLDRPGVLPSIISIFWFFWGDGQNKSTCIECLPSLQVSKRLFSSSNWANWNGLVLLFGAAEQFLLHL